MAKTVEVHLGDGKTMKYESTIFTGYHVKEAKDGFCVVKTGWFSEPETVACFPKKKDLEVKEESCSFCEAVNPAQRKP